MLTHKFQVIDKKRYQYIGLELLRLFFAISILLNHCAGDAAWGGGSAALNGHILPYLRCGRIYDHFGIFHCKFFFALR
jgi:hypothetical protein